MFPGGKDVLFEALRVRELEDFFTGSEPTSMAPSRFEDLLVRCVVHATHELRGDQHLSLMLASEPGEVRGRSPSMGCPVIRDRHRVPAPLVARWIGGSEPLELVELLAVWSSVLLPRPIANKSISVNPSRQNRSSNLHTSGLPAITDQELTTMTVTHNDNETIIGRAEINDIDAILAIPTHDPDEIAHIVKDNADAIFTWDYSLSRPALRKLYEKAKVGQWNATTDLPWDTDVDIEKTVAEDQALIGTGIDASMYIGTPVEKWDDKQWLEFGVESRNWILSQFMHGEQGALLCTAKIVETVPWYDAKLYASTQVVDEARHVEVFARYLDEKLGGRYQINSHLRMLLDDIVNDSRWDMTYLGMQVMVEGLALAAFGFMHQFTGEPLLKQLLRYVMSDEARHVAFGVLSLQEVYKSLSDAEMKDRQEFAFEAAIRLRDRFMQQEVWERMGSTGARRRAARAAGPDARPCSSRCCSPRSCRTARSSVCSTATTSGCATASRRWVSSSSRTGKTPARSTSSSSSARTRRLPCPPDGCLLPRWAGAGAAGCVRA